MIAFDEKQIVNTLRQISIIEGEMTIAGRQIAIIEREMSNT